MNIRSSDIVIIIGGQSGTLGEYAIAYDEGRLIGVVSGSGGIADLVPELLERLTKNTGADGDPRCGIIFRRGSCSASSTTISPCTGAVHTVSTDPWCRQSRRTRSPNNGTTRVPPEPG